MFEKLVKNMDIWDVGLVKLAVAAFMLALIKWPAFLDWALSVNIWWFIGIVIVAVGIVEYRVWR